MQKRNPAVSRTKRETAGGNGNRILQVPRRDFNRCLGAGLLLSLVPFPASSASSDKQRCMPEDAPLHHGNLSSVNSMLDNGAEIDCTDWRGDTPLLSAARRRNPRLVRFLISRGANLEARNKEGKTALMLAALNDDFGTMKVLVENGADTSDATNAVFRFACYEGNLELAESMLDRNAYIEDTDLAGNTPLLIAVDRGNTKLVRFLISRGANLEARNKDGRTALMLAAYEGFSSPQSSWWRTEPM